MGLVNLKALPDFIKVNQVNYAAYKSEFKGIRGIRLFNFDISSGDTFNYQYIVLEIDETLTELTRDEIVALLTCENLSARRYFYPGCHRMEPYKSFFPNAGLLLPVKKVICTSVICLPTGTGISLMQIRQVGALLRFLIANATEIKRRIIELPIAPGDLPSK